jgi:hypothetical protein
MIHTSTNLPLRANTPQFAVLCFFGAFESFKTTKKFAQE